MIKNFDKFNENKKLAKQFGLQKECESYSEAWQNLQESAIKKMIATILSELEDEFDTVDDSKEVQDAQFPENHKNTYYVTTILKEGKKFDVFAKLDEGIHIASYFSKRIATNRRSGASACADNMKKFTELFHKIYTKWETRE